MELSRALVFLCLVIAVGAQRDHRVICYLDVLTPRTREGSCSHVIVPSAWSTDGFDLQSLSEDDYDTLRKMKERNPTLKILLGLEVKASRLQLMFTNEPIVEDFIHTVLGYLKKNHFDGLDVALVNSFDSDESSKGTELLTNFLKSLRGEEDDGRSLLLSVSLSDHSEHSAIIHEQTLEQYVDFISILPGLLEEDGPYINGTVQRWKDHQIDLQKLNVAIPAFLRRPNRGHHHHKSQPGSHNTNRGEGEKYLVHGVTFNLASQVCQAIKSGQEKLITITSVSDKQGLAEEVSWLLQKGFGGIEVVFIELDIFCKSVCANITQDERAIVESKAIHRHGGRGHEHDNHHRRRQHHRSHGDHHHYPDVPHGGHDNGHHHHRRHHHHHGHHRHGHHHRHHHHNHHHHYHQPRVTSTEEQLE